MTARQVWDSIPIKVLVLIVAGVLAFAQLQSQVMQKADRQTVEEMARDIKTIKAILCGKASGDSYCQRGS